MAEVAPRQFLLYRSRAAALLGSSEDVRVLTVRAAKKLASSPGSSLKVAGEQLSLLIDLLAAVANGSYRGVSRNALIAIAAALLYFVVPLDLVPDMILGLGLLDDAAVIGYVVRMLRAELRQFEAWRAPAHAPGEQH